MFRKKAFHLGQIGRTPTQECQVQPEAGRTARDVTAPDERLQRTAAERGRMRAQFGMAPEIPDPPKSSPYEDLGQLIGSLRGDIDLPVAS